ncbi:hypothetical protein CIAM_44010 (plasmid) [Citrobacter amalonaticus]|nr:hypothetical protein CIAM_44010 [Citrobacter amalonaticus]
MKHIARDPDSMPGRDKPQGILNFAAHCSVQGQDKLTFPVRVRGDAGIFLSLDRLQSDGWLGKRICIKLVR